MKKFNYAYLCPSAALERFEVWFNYLNIMKLRIMLQNYWCGKRGKAAVNNPTGSGESFIGFKLCEAHPDSRVCWLSPSSYIFDTQIENLRSTMAGCAPETSSSSHMPSSCFGTKMKCKLFSRTSLFLLSFIGVERKCGDKVSELAGQDTNGSGRLDLRRQNAIFKVTKTFL